SALCSLSDAPGPRRLRSSFPTRRSSDLPRLLILDEPSQGLAPMIVREVFRVVAQMRDEGISVLLVEQNVRMSLEISDHVYVLDRSEEHTSELQSLTNLVCRLLLEKKTAPAGGGRGGARRQARLHREANRQHAGGRAGDRGAGAAARRHRDGRAQPAPDGRHHDVPRLMVGIKQTRDAIDAGELGRVAFMESNFSNERALELTPSTWRWYKARAPGGPLSQLAIHFFDVLRYPRGYIVFPTTTPSK